LPVPKPLNISLLLAARVPGLVMFNQLNNISIEPTHLQSHTDLFNLQRNGVPTGAV